jgi:hypothetical protein
MRDVASTTPELPDQRRRSIPMKIRGACAALVSGEVKTITAAAEKVGLSREHLSRELGRPHISAYFRDRVAKAVALTSGRAAARLAELLDADSEHVSLDAAKLSLGIAGIKPAPEASVNLNVELRAGFVLDLREPSEARPMKVVSPEPSA